MGDCISIWVLGHAVLCLAFRQCRGLQHPFSTLKSSPSHFGFIFQAWLCKARALSPISWAFGCHGLKHDYPHDKQLIGTRNLSILSCSSSHLPCCCKHQILCQRQWPRAEARKSSSHCQGLSVRVYTQCSYSRSAEIKVACAAEVLIPSRNHRKM